MTRRRRWVVLVLVVLLLIGPGWWYWFNKPSSGLRRSAELWVAKAAVAMGMDWPWAHRVVALDELSKGLERLEVEMQESIEGSTDQRFLQLGRQKKED